MKRTFLSALVVLAALRVAGEEPMAPEPVRLSLAEAIERARAASPRLGALAAYERAADAGLRGAKAQRLPSLGLAAGYSRNSNVPEFVTNVPGEGETVIFPNLPNQGYARATLGLPLYTGGRIAGEVAAGEAQRTAARLDRSAGDRDLVLETTRAYWQLVAERESARVLGEAIAAYESHLTDARNRYDAGMAARNEVLAVQVERDRAELARLSAENAAAVAEADLVRILDLPAAARIEPTSDGAGAEAPVADAATLVAVALEARPELGALRARVSAADASVRTARSAALPHANLQGSYDYANPNQRIFPLEGVWRDTWSVGASVTWNAFDGGRTKAATAQAQALADAERLALQDQERRIRLEVTSRVLDVRTAAAALAVAERNVEAAQENVRVNQDRYKEGVSLSSDLLDAETQLLSAGLDRTRSETRLLVARASLERAVGR
jgi:outer membrane protein TolC